KGPAIRDRTGTRSRATALFQPPRERAEQPGPGAQGQPAPSDRESPDLHPDSAWLPEAVAAREIPAGRWGDGAWLLDAFQPVDQGGGSSIDGADGQSRQGGSRHGGEGSVANGVSGCG